MAQNTFALMTNLGRAKEAAALANGTSVVITHIAIGDGTTVPSGGETALYHEVARKAISGHGTVVGASNVAYFDIFLEAAEGPYTIREAGLIDQDGDLIAIARYDPPISKPIPSSGQTVEGTIRLEIAFSNISAITIIVDPAFKISLQRLNRLPWVSVLSMAVSAPPSNPAVGDLYLVPSGSTGAWGGQAGKLAEYTSAGWGIITPPNGHGISLPDGRVFERVAGNYVEKLAIDAQSGKWNFVQADGSPNAITGILTPAITAYPVGLEVQVKIAESNTGPVTLDLGGGAKPVTTPSGSPLQSADLSSGGVYSFIYNGVSWTVLIEGQRVLDGDITLYVRSDGNDANDGMANTAAGAFRTIQRAIDVAQRRYVSAAYKITIQVGKGVYSAFRLSGGASTFVEVVGDTATPSNVSIAADTSGAAVTAATNSTLRVRGVKAAGGTNVIVALDRSNIEVSDIEVGSCVNYQLYASNNSSISVTGNIACSGGARAMFCASSNGVINCSNRAVTFKNAVNFSVGTCFSNNGTMVFTGSTWTGAAFVTGPRYLANITGLIYTEGGGANFIPGSAAGSVTTGGLYL
nr:phage tail protein [Brucella anthropi]